ncbi:hypothetical protein [Mycoplasmopsis agassizii]|uniref:DUF304 domain-containing protein n=1 Tax=Mycoplasmopsis agassizii TaxID=33922 RepID=A0ABX4H629_9BACT|nr:hypothetical protein [Mycoplasmopsis agassizii]PAF55272.1 hypothetical protein CJF60_01115 [Mycoplasmopsis agassizii]SMC15690.1 hypothetical protein SAMN02745179_00040 [Mycoplasmopsis agassizii]
MNQHRDLHTNKFNSFDDLNKKIRIAFYYTISEVIFFIIALSFLIINIFLTNEFKINFNTTNSVIAIIPGLVVAGLWIIFYAVGSYLRFNWIVKSDYIIKSKDEDLNIYLNKISMFLRYPILNMIFINRLRKLIKEIPSERR